MILQRKATLQAGDWIDWFDWTIYAGGAEVTIPAGGSVSGGGVVNSGDSVTVVASAASGYTQAITEFHIVGGLHPDLPFEYFLDLIRGLKQRFPRVHLKAFTMVEIAYLARRAKLTIRETLEQLKAAGVESLPGGGARQYHGIVSSLSLLDSDSVLDHYRMVLAPRLSLLGLVKRSRIFQNATAVDIIRVLLEPAGGARFQLTGAPPSRVTCAQYRETDLEFFLRLCSEEGFIHYWTHSLENHELVVTDTTPEVPSVGTVPYDLTVGGTGDSTFIRSWILTQRQVPTAAQVGGSHMQVYGQSLAYEASAPSAVSAASISLTPSGNPGPWEEDGQSATRFFDAVNASGGEDTTAIGSRVIDSALAAASDAL